MSRTNNRSITPRKPVAGSKVRRPVRISLSKKIAIGAVAGVLVAALLCVAWVKRGPIIAAGEEFVASTVDARLEHVMVEGLTYADPEDLLAAVGLKKGDSLVGYDALAARTRMEELSWVRLASVRRRLPDTIQVEIFEYKPVARLIEEDEAWVINAEGRQIAPIDDRFDQLPVLSGEGVAEQAAGFFALMAPHQNLMAHISQARLVGNRRWDLVFNSGVTVQLPEEKPAQALLILLRLEAERGVLNMKGGSIDLRLEDRIYLRPPETVGLGTGSTSGHVLRQGRPA